MGNSATGHTNAARQLSRIQYPSLVVREHRPEPPEGLRRNAHSELGNIAFQVSANEIATPPQANRVILRQDRSRKPAAYP